MQDRIPTYPGRVKLTPVTGEENIYDMERADEPTQVGTPLNKETFLTDSTETAIWGDAQDRTVDDAFNAFNNKCDTKSYEIIMEITTESEVAQVELDLSEIDITKYSALTFTVEGAWNGTSTTNYAPAAMRVNNNSESIYCINGGDSSNMRDYISIISGANSRLTNPGSSAFVRVFPAGAHTSMICEHLQATASTTSGTQANALGCGTLFAMVFDIPFSEINSFQIFINTADYLVPVGFHITLWGVKA